ncbi:PP2C family serine/threonine-protein phosphatase [Bifidobacterium sp. ESL0763]|uniref:PP2C family protein-serine/threonine phosphatase n=1 Tax=Bifidobacterium sp. ESL0763 TaxID=2983227 RepID=UPI0035A93DAB
MDFDGPARPDDPAAGAPCEAQPLYLYSTTVSDVGTVRSNNQDSSFAGERLIAICDGMGGHAGGDTASTIAIRSLSHIEQNDPSADVASVASMMETSVMAAHDAIVGKAKRERSLAGMGTTVTAVSLVAGHWVVTHIGDSRAYLLRDGKLRRMTQDHSYVQHLIDTGRITEAEARNHPQRNVVMRVLGDFDIDPHPDIAVIKAEPTDRWLLCSDGLCGVLEDTTIEDVLATVSDSEECAQRLVAMSLKAGSTDNVTAVVADAILALSATGFDVPHQTPLIGGAASSNLEAIADIVKVPVASAPALRLGKQSPALRAAALSHGPAASSPAASGADPDADAGDLGDDSAGTADTEANTAAQTDAASVSPSQPGISEAAAEVAAAPTEPVHVAKPAAVRDENDTKANMDTGEIPVVKKKDGRLSADPNDPEVARVIRKKRLRAKQKSRKRHSHWRLAIIIAAVVVVVAVLGGGAGAYRWSQTKYYLGKSQGKVAIYQGVNTNFFGARLSHEIETTDISSSQLPQSWDDALDQGITVDSLDDAHSHVRMIRKEARNLKTSKGKSAPLPWTADARAKDDGNSDAKTAPKDQPAGQSKSSKPDSQSDQGKAGDSGTSADSGNATFGADPKAASQ